MELVFSSGLAVKECSDIKKERISKILALKRSCHKDPLAHEKEDKIKLVQSVGSSHSSSSVIRVCHARKLKQPPHVQ